jgi:hypothetical protein
MCTLLWVLFYVYVSILLHYLLFTALQIRAYAVIYFTNYSLIAHSLSWPANNVRSTIKGLSVN